MPAQLISHYRILGPLGSGGMGVVYRAEDTTLHRTVALKFVTEPAVRRGKANQGLRREARAASALNHPNICTIYEVGEDAGETFIAMEYVDGRTLAELIHQSSLPIATVLRLGCQISSALAHAHERGVIHSDLKPKNIVITPDGEAKILDFGLARRADPTEFDKKTLETVSATNDVGFGGTFPYMAPEQVEGSDASPRTDIWSFGVVLYEMVTRQRPFQGENLFLLCNAILRDPPQPLPPQVLPGLSNIIYRCLQKEPQRRYHRAGEACAALEALSPGMGKSPTRLAVPQRSIRFRAALAGAALLVLALVGLLVVRSHWPWKLGSTSPVPSRVVLGILPPIGTGDASQLAFDHGLADTLNSRLGELSARHPFAVIPMNSTVEQRVDTVDAARQQFGVNLVLVLNVQRAAGLVGVNYSLVDANSHEQVRSGTVTAAEADPFALQDRVFESVAAAMELQLAPQEKQTLVSHGTNQPAAYDFYVQGRGYLQEYVVPEKVDNAITLFAHALAKDPSYAEATAGLGEAYWRKYQITHDPQWADAAILNCQKAADQNSNLASAHTCLGRAFSATGNYEESARQYRRALELDSGRDDAYDGLAAAYAHLDRLAEAEQLYKQAISLRPEYWATYNRLGLFYMAHARYEEAVSMFSEVVSLAPDSFTGYYNLGAVRVLQGKYEDAIPVLERSLSIRPTGNAFTNLGTALFQMRRYPEAAAKFEQAVKLDEKDYVLWGNLGDAYYWTPGRRAEATAAYEKAIALAERNLQLNPHDAQLFGYLAEYHAMRGERKPALTNLQASLRLQPKSPDMLLNAGIVYQQLGETNQALDALERAVSLGLSPEVLRDTPNFDALKGNPRFTKLIENARQN